MSTKRERERRAKKRVHGKPRTAPKKRSIVPEPKEARTPMDQVRDVFMSREFYDDLERRTNG